MNKQLIERLAAQAGFDIERAWPRAAPLDRPDESLEVWFDGAYVGTELARFAALVRAEALEDAAKACEGIPHPTGPAAQCADAIRRLR